LAQKRLFSEQKRAKNGPKVSQKRRFCPKRATPPSAGHRRNPRKYYTSKRSGCPALSQMLPRSAARGRLFRSGSRPQPQAPDIATNCLLIAAYNTYSFDPQMKDQALLDAFGRRIHRSVTTELIRDRPTRVRGIGDC